ncbi:fluoride efflux transporter CrcB [Campylobacter insulaenigrae]|uniref:fluoride efflux transporter CrcB n=1 Tax=Campylobacter insulaenigrae TaxID=260714 RepID=UPI0021530621|nr:fluoride efflux transporter CrcB [Campylobacter insulaenigrae]MCR6570150.1 fluoride efflux transporter CrcB [Campylobacter insulaenigrae]MCR6571935.1 fluoride efflux transporter CrcB [Campylobacter insulaenigrae]MCR6574980.1 fluoride efflux transporter CrcB [Campylobacter insulaenigrae]MCR6581283.1 fluoride efflux transporter CrcB [Campylobacter insulaenigrae]MCR6585557.1 fluoride efflux transporter CrcB [Campylobacter insulaenigrae]
MIYTLLAVGFGGFLGAIVRILTTSICNKLLPHNFAYGTLMVNIIGSFLMGMFFSYINSKELNILLKSFLSTGFLGAFTTFSAFSYENLLFLQSENYFHFIVNIISHLSLCLLAVWLGYLIFK